MSVKRLLKEVDSEEMTMWQAYDQRWPLPDSWAETARICRIVMCASGNYRKHDIPDETAFMPIVVKPEQTQQQIVNEFMKLKAPPQG
jgi:hypothetical protein